MSFLKNTPTKTINIVIAVISIAVPALVIAMLKIAPPEITSTVNLSFFPKFNAFVNSGTTICLLLGLVFIKNKRLTFVNKFKAQQQWYEPYYLKILKNFKSD